MLENIYDRRIALFEFIFVFCFFSMVFLLIFRIRYMMSWMRKQHFRLNVSVLGYRSELAPCEDRPCKRFRNRHFALITFLHVCIIQPSLSYFSDNHCGSSVDVIEILKYSTILPFNHENTFT